MLFRPTMKSLKSFAVAAFASAAMFGGNVDAQWIDNSSSVRLDAAGMAGSQPGVKDGYYRVGGFLSIFEDSESVLFVDGHGNVNEVLGDWSTDIGIGYRQDVDGTVLGANAYYNYREDSNGRYDHNFSTLGFGVEALMSDWAVRSNAYVSLDDRGSNGRTATPLMGGPDFVPQMGGSMGVSNIRLATQTENWTEALDGFDLNVSRKIPEANLEVGAGVYYLSADEGPSSWGVNGTAEAWLASNIAANVTVSHDDLFDTTVYGGVSIYFGGPSIDAESRSASVSSRLLSRVQRRHVAPVLNYNAAAPDLLATDATSGDLITVAQIAMGGDLLNAPDLLEDDGDFIDIILVDPGAAFTPMDTIALNDGQRLLSAHLLHTVDTTESGIIDLPESGLGGMSAMITGSPGFDAITLADGNEVSGFSIVAGSGESGIFGSDVTGFNINNNVLDGATAGGDEGIEIDSSGLASVSGTISDNMISGFDDDGIQIDGVDIEVDFLNNMITGNFGDGLDIDGTGDFSGMIMGNTLNNNDADGLDLDALTFSGSIIDNFANMNDLSGLAIDIDDNVLAGSVLTMTDNTTNLNGDDGISVIFNGALDSEVFIDDNTADGNGGDGISVVSTGMGDILGAISNNTTNGNDPGIFVQSNDAASDIMLDIIGNLSGGNTQEGILVEAANDFSGEVSGNITSLNGSDGLAIIADNNFSGLINNNTASMNGGSGLQLEADIDISGTGDFTADVTNNTGNNNTGDEGILIGGANVNSQVTGNTANDNTSLAGIRVAADGNIAGLIDDNTANGNADEGIEVLADFDGNNIGDVTATVSNNTTGVMGNGNGDAGILIQGENLTGDVTGNTADANTSNGVTLDAENAIGVMGMPVQVTGNMIGQVAANGGIGLNLDAAVDSIFANVDNNMVALSGGDNISITALAGSVNGSVAGNTANGSTGGNGIDIDADNIFSDVTGNTANMNSSAGLRLFGMNDITSNVTGNTANANLNNGLFIFAANDITGNVTGNTAGIILSGNGAGGILIQGENITGNVTGNFADGNTGNGIELDAANAIGVMGTPVQVTGNMIGQTAANGGIGLRLDAKVDSIFANVDNNMVALSGLDNISITAAGSINGTVAGNTANGSTSGSGIEIAADNIFSSVTGNTASTNAVYGILMNASTDIGAMGAPVLVQLNETDSNTNDGLVFFASGDLFATIDQNMSDGNLNGIDINVIGNFNGAVTNNTVDMSGSSNYFISASDLNIDLTGNTSTNNAASQGFLVLVSGDFTGDVLMNTATGSDRKGFDFNITGNFDGDFLGNTATGNDVGLGGFDDYDTGAGTITIGSQLGANTGGTFGNTTGNAVQIARELLFIQP